MLVQKWKLACATFSPPWNGVVWDVVLSALERANKIYDYERIIVFKYDIVIRFTLIPFLDGNWAVVSFLSLYNVVVGNALLLEGKVVGASFPQWTIKMMQFMF